ncbi:MAG: hypothetical protein FJY83_07530, partial [Candidatus Aminicenantes bacterium]|nr:hypothetical protein [Candidatus Aminicenantes bacterium]
MLQELFPRVHGRYSSLPVLGPTTEGFAAFLVGRGYPRRLVRFHLRAARRVDERLRRRRCRSITEITWADLQGCAPAAGRSQEDASSSAVVRLLEIYLTEQGLLLRPELSNPAEQRLGDYGRYLEKVRGLARTTIEAHLATASRFVAHLNTVSTAAACPQPTAQDVETFVRDTGRRISRATLQHTVAHLRSLLRFLAARGEITAGLD